MHGEVCWALETPHDAQACCNFVQLEQLGCVLIAIDCHCSKAEGTTHQAELAEDDVLHIRGAILALEHQFTLQRRLAGTSLAFSPQDGSPSVDGRGIIPWHPNGAPFELTIPMVRPVHRAKAVAANISSDLTYILLSIFFAFRFIVAYATVCC